MSNFFGDASDSEESMYDEDDVSVVDEDDEQLNDGFNKWLKHSDDEASGDDDDGNRGLMSNKDKANDKIQNICDEIDFNFGDDWAESYDLFTNICKLGVEFANKYKTRSIPFLQSLQQCITILGDHKDETKENFEGDNRAWKAFQALNKQVAERALECAKDLERLANGDVAEDEEEKEDDKKVEDWTENGMLEMLREIVTKTKGRANRCEKIVACAEQQGHKHIVVAAAALVCSSRLSEDPNPNFVSTKTWRRSFDALDKALTIAEENNSLTVAENDSDFLLTARRTLVAGGFYALATTLHKAVVSGCQFTEGSSPQYFQRVVDENDMVYLLDRVLAYYVKKGLKKAIVRVSLALLEILSPRRLAAHAALQASLKKRSNHFVTDDLVASVEELHRLVMANNADSETEAIATLYVVYNFAIRDEFYAGRDLMLRSRLHEYFQLKSETFRVLFNRVIVHLGMCAFRVGLFNESVTTLAELCQKTGRELRELIGQKEVHKVRAQSYDEKKELEDRDRLVPPHQQVSATLVEVSNLVLSMLTDVVTETKSPFERTQRSKHFFNLCKRQGNMPLSGPASDDFEKIFAASEAMQKGDVDSTVNYLMSLDAWKYLHEKDATLKLLEDRVKVDCLKVFVITYGSNYESLTLERMAGKFMLTEGAVRAQVSRLLLDNTIVGHWDQAETCLTIERGTMSRLHHLVKECNERVGHFSAYNDQVAHIATHGAGSRSDHRSGRSMWGGGRGRGRGRGN